MSHGRKITREPTLAEVMAELAEQRRLLAAIVGTLRARKVAPTKRRLTVVATAAKHARTGSVVPSETEVAMARRIQARW